MSEDSSVISQDLHNNEIVIQATMKKDFLVTNVRRMLSNMQDLSTVSLNNKTKRHLIKLANNRSKSFFMKDWQGRGEEVSNVVYRPSSLVVASLQEQQRWTMWKCSGESTFSSWR